MKTKTLKNKITKNMKYGVLNNTLNMIESHHKTKTAAEKRAKRQTKIWKNKRTFEIVKIIN